MKISKSLLFIKIYLFLNIIFINNLSADTQTVINFAPLPMKNSSKVIQDFIPLSSYLNKELNVKLKFIKKENYEDILKGLINGEIDMAQLGPLPLLSLKQQYTHIKPIVAFKQNNGSKYYKCVLVKFKKDSFDPKKTFKIALTQPLSTCGYFMSKKLLKENFDTNINDNLYEYTKSHTNAILSTLGGEFSVAGAKESIAKKHETLGMEIIAKSENLPGFSLVVNTKTLSNKQIQKIESTILNIEKKIYKSWKGILNKGFEKVDIKEYEKLKVDFNDIPLKGNIR